MILLSDPRDDDDILRPPPVAADERPADVGRLTAERDAARAEVAALRARLDHEANAAAAAIERLTREMREARRLVVRSESYRADRRTLDRLADLLGGGFATAAQTGGLELLQGNFAGAAAAWRAEVAAERAELKAQLEVARAQSVAVTASPGRMAAAMRLRRAAARVAGRGGPAPALAAPPPRPVAGSTPTHPSALERLDALAGRVEAEVSLMSDLLRGLSNILGLQTGTQATEPGSDLYRSLPLERQLTAWIRFDAARQRRMRA